MRFVIMPDSFKAAITAKDAARAIKRGVLRAHPRATCVLMPVGDGGENTIASLIKPLNLQARNVRVTGAAGEPIEAPYYYAEATQTMYVQVADVVGYAGYVGKSVPILERTTYGIGELITVGVVAGAAHVVLALGGSATTDGGLGMLQALGFTLSGVNRGSGPFVPAQLADVQTIAAPNRVLGVDFTVLGDVTNPLLGEQGAAAVFGPQKGLAPEEVKWVDQHLERLYAQYVGAAEAPGAGAAGGIGAAVVGPLNGTIVRGIDYVLDAIGADAELAKADVVITGEGHLDAQTGGGKVIAGVTQRVRKVNKAAKVVALCGAVDPNGVATVGVDAAFAIAPKLAPLPDLLAQTAVNLEFTAMNVAALVR